MENILFIDLLEQLIYAEILFNSYEEYTEEVIIGCFINDTEVDVPFYEIIKEYLKDSVKFEEFIKKSKEEQFYFLIEELLPKLKEEYSYDLLFIILQYELEGMEMLDSFAYQNLFELNHFLKEHYNDSEKQIEIDYDTLSNVPIEKTLELVISFLDFIDPTHQWSNILKQEINSGSICLWNIKTDEIPAIVCKQVSEICYYEWCVDFDTELVLNAPYEENILDVYRLIHEFMHYLIKMEREEFGFSDNFYVEFMSIFFERYAYHYFKKYFPSQEDIEEIYKYRNELDNRKIDFYQILVLMKEKIITSKDDLKKFIEKKYKEPSDICEILITNSILNDGRCYEFYHYVVGVVISDNLIEKISNGNTYLLDKIKNLPKYLKEDPTSLEVLDYLEMKTFSQKFKQNKLIREKKL